MAGEYDSTEFIDTDFTAQKSPFAAPTRDDVDRKVVEAQQKLVELKRAQEELERERAGLEELRRRQNEFTTGRQEIIQQLTRGPGRLAEAECAPRRREKNRPPRENESPPARQKITQQLPRARGLQEEAEFPPRRDAEQMVKT